MSSAKSEVASLLETLPEESSLEDIQYHLFVLEKIKRGIGRADVEGVLTQSEMEQRFGQWLET